MSNQIQEIREILNDIKDVINETYVYGQNNSKMLPEEENEINSTDNLDIPNENPIEDRSVDKKININREIEEIRKLALKLLPELSPIDNPEECKLLKGIWNSCDSFLDKGKKQPKEQNNNI